MCHDVKAGMVQRILGDNYGQLILTDKWESDPNSQDPFRFCHWTHKHPDIPNVYKYFDNGKIWANGRSR